MLVAGLIAVCAVPSSAQAVQVCNWGGTPLAPTGEATFTPGLNNDPAPEPLEFTATGRLSGGGRCTGRMTFRGQADAGSTCLQGTFQARVIGVPGVTRMWGTGNGVVEEILYDDSGNVVGTDQVLASPPPDDPFFSACGTPEGLTRVSFSARLELFDPDPGP